MLLLVIVLPIITGALLPAFHWTSPRMRNLYVLATTVINSLLVAVLVLQGQASMDLLQFSERLKFSLRMDGLSQLFAGLLALLWPVTTVFSFGYMKGKPQQNSFYAFFMMSYGATLGVALGANLLTLYIFYEMMSLTTLPLVMHGGSPSAIKAGLKYLYYSLGGSGFAFIGLVYVLYFGAGSNFVPGGLFANVALEHSQQLRLGYLLCFLGFSVKAAVFPVHGWLPTASVAPTPVTALLHAVAVVKSGVFAILRVTFYSFGAVVIRGSYAQYIPLALSIFTIVYGCSMALKEQHLKRRLAWSTVSNLSYILFGALLLTPAGLRAGLLHLVFHALMKITLFMTAGVFKERAHVNHVQQLRGINAQLPLYAAIFTLGSLAMTGIPPLIGFISKWALALAGVRLGGWLPMLGLAALLISALLTAGYLMVPSVLMYTGRPPETLTIDRVENSFRVSLVFLSVLILGLSFYSSPLSSWLNTVAMGAM